MKYISLIIIFLIIGCAPKEIIIPQEGYIQRVIDGDTFTIFLEGREQKVRIIGVNTPELKKDCFGEEAKNKLQELIENKKITIEKDPLLRNKDPFGRLLRKVEINGTDIGQVLLSEGYARIYGKWRGQKFLQYVQLEGEAKRLKKGLWDKCSNEAIS